MTIDIPSGYTPGVDLVEMLRNQVEHWNSGLRFVAADEIVRLRAENANLEKEARIADGSEGIMAEENVAIRALNAELVEALKASSEVYCSKMCPSIWFTNEHPEQPHTDQCKHNHDLITRAEGR